MSELTEIFEEIDTPAIVIDMDVMTRNISDMQRFADQNNILLRPHIKTHKIARFAKVQMEEGAKGIAVAKLSEAEVMIDNGILDIQIANEIVGRQKIGKLASLARRARIECAVDSLAGIKSLAEEAGLHNLVLDVLVEIDSGLGRCGVRDEAAARKLCLAISRHKNLNLIGIMTHAGHAYGADSQEKIKEIGRREGERMVAIAGALSAAGLHIEKVSVGSTPTAKYCGSVPGVTELRVGNYLFNDYTQVSLGTAEIDQCALSVMATVISTPANDRAVIDAGSKAFGLDRGAHGAQIMAGFGHVRGKKATLERLSEEHGIIRHEGERFAVGEKVLVIPNHACTVINLFDFVHLVANGNIVGKIPIDARGKSQ